MPGMQGPELARRLQAARPGVRLLFMSGYAGRSLEEHGLATSDWPLLEKPFTRASLANAVRDALASG